MDRIQLIEYNAYNTIPRIQCIWYNVQNTIRRVQCIEYNVYNRMHILEGKYYIVNNVYNAWIACTEHVEFICV